MRLRNRDTKEIIDAHWELPRNRLMTHPVLIAENDDGGYPIPKAIADRYVLVSATLAEMRVGVDHGFRFHEQRSLQALRGVTQA